MNKRLVDGIKQALCKKEDLSKIRSDLINSGYLEIDINEAANEASRHIAKEKRKTHIIKSSKFAFKEFFDRIGFGFASPQFINILFMQTGASYFLIGVINGIKAMFSVLTSWFLKDYSKTFKSNKTVVFYSGILFAMSFILMVFARNTYSRATFAVAILFAAIVIVFYGDLYNNLIKENIIKERINFFLKKISHTGLIITGIALLFAGFVLDWLSVGYFFVFLAASVFFVLSSIIIATIREKKNEFVIKRSVATQLRICLSTFRENLPLFMKDRIMVVLLITSAITGLVHCLGDSFYGIFIYKELGTTGYGPFMNVAIVFVFAVFASLIGPMIAQKNAREYGKVPMLVFGTFLIAIMPLTYYYNPQLAPISMATMVGIIGSSIVGVAQGLLVVDFIEEKKRKAYYTLSGLLSVIPYIVLVPLGAYVAQLFGLRILFLSLALVLLIAVVPLYFMVLIEYNKNKNKI